MGPQLLTNAAHRLYYEACERYYNWYCPVDDGFRLPKWDWYFYNFFCWGYFISEELYFNVTRAGDKTSELAHLTNALVCGFSVGWFISDLNIRKYKKRFRVGKEKEHAIEGAQDQPDSGKPAGSADQEG